jgi:hypothetical protein
LCYDASHEKGCLLSSRGSMVAGRKKVLSSNGELSQPSLTPDLEDETIPEEGARS